MTTTERHEVKKTVLKAIAGFPIEFSEEDVENLVCRIERAVKDGPAEGKRHNVEGFSYLTARNWALDRQQRLAVAARRKAKALLAAEEEKRERGLYERALREFDGVVSRLLLDFQGVQRQQVAMVRWRCFENLSDSQCAKRLPGTSYAQRCQWRTRGIKLILNYAPPTLRKYLRGQQRQSHNCHNN